MCTRREKAPKRNGGASLDLPDLSIDFLIAHHDIGIKQGIVIRRENLNRLHG
jgi:hypothetical protein